MGSPFCLLPYQDAARSPHQMLEPHLNFSASRTMGNKFMFFTNYPVSSILLWQHKTD
jgi:hypothetical protein